MSAPAKASHLPPPGAGSVALDLLAFGAGLVLAWQQGWKAADLVWSLWLSSLVVGYAMIVWIIAGPLVRGGPAAWEGTKPAGGPALRVIGGLFLLAFFTVHFGGFHFGHSVFLGMFFPLVPGGETPNWATYSEVWTRYWVWLPLAFVAERAGFTPAADPKAKKLAPMTVPYRNVIRMHLLIFFFAGAHFAKVDNFAVYAVVYAAYFLPWTALWRAIKGHA
ncbi:MAG: hypothetical protein JNK23_17715 [Opitutaceae bacterium]|nr:hypothetical protein [Opitutaceae bacterium]